LRLPVRPHRPRPKTIREYVEGLDVSVDRIERTLSRIEGKVDRTMALTQKEADAFTALVTKLDEVFVGTGPVIEELKAQVTALQAEDAVDQAEVDRLQALIDAAPSEQDVVDAIQAVSDHVAGLAGPPA
jgi:hypothetical protein